MKLKQLSAITKRKWCISVIGILIFLLMFFQFGQDVKINNTTRHSYGNGSEEYLSITANRLYIINKQKFAQEILQRRMNDSFKDVRFMGSYPDKIIMEIYMNDWTWEINKRAFLIICEQDDTGAYELSIQ